MAEIAYWLRFVAFVAWRAFKFWSAIACGVVAALALFGGMFYALNHWMVPSIIVLGSLTVLFFSAPSLERVYYQFKYGELDRLARARTLISKSTPGEAT